MKALIIVLVLVFAVAVATAQAGGVTVTFEPAQVAVGEQFNVEVCGTGGRIVWLHVTYPDGTVQRLQFYSSYPGEGCENSYITLVASQAGTYTVEVLNKNESNVVGSGSGTAS